MQRAIAIKKITKLLGKQAAVRVDDKAPTAEQRQEAKERHPALAQAKADAEKAMMARKESLLAGDAEYRRLLGEWRTAKSSIEEVNSVIYRHRFTAGTVGLGFFSVRAQGDTWEEVISKLEGH